MNEIVELKTIHISYNNNVKSFFYHITFLILSQE